MTACILCRVGSLPAALCELSGLKDLHIRGELPIDEDGDQVMFTSEEPRDVHRECAPYRNLPALAPPDALQTEHKGQGLLDVPCCSGQKQAC